MKSGNLALPPPSRYRPLHIKFMMASLRSAWASGLLQPADLCPDRLRAIAEKDTGLSRDTIDRAHFEDQIAVLLPALHEEARLTDFGRLVAHGALLKLMKERLWFEDLLASHPEIDAIELAPPIVVVGSMRSGTTRMQRLLAADPAFNALALYEAHAPVPGPRSFAARSSGRADPRLAQVGLALKLIGSINPTIFEIHPTGPAEVDEELGLLDQSLSSAMIETQRRVPSFVAHAEATDQLPAYRRMARLLKLAVWFSGRDPARPFILKTPQHMQDLKCLHAVFPAAHFLFLHRDPVALVGSAASLAWNQMVVQSDSVDAHWVGAEWLRKTELRLRRAEADRAAIPVGHQIDIGFAAMNADWRGQMARVYGFLGRELTPDALAAMEAYAARAAAEHGHARHRYTLEAFGLSPGTVRERLARWSLEPEALAA